MCWVFIASSKEMEVFLHMFLAFSSCSAFEDCREDTVESPR